MKNHTLFSLSIYHNFLLSTGSTLSFNSNVRVKFLIFIYVLFYNVEKLYAYLSFSAFAEISGKSLSLYLQLDRVRNRWVSLQNSLINSLRFGPWGIFGCFLHSHKVFSLFRLLENRSQNRWKISAMVHTALAKVEITRLERNSKNSLVRFDCALLIRSRFSFHERIIKSFNESFCT